MKYSRKVIAVYRLPVENAAPLLRTDVNKVSFSGSPEWEKLNIRVPAELVISSKTEDKQPVYTAKLTFVFCGERYERQRFIYMAVLADGEKIIIGSDARPYPVSESSEEHSSGDSSNQQLEVSVTYSSHMEIARL